MYRWPWTGTLRTVHALVTGAAGFVGSTLVEDLLTSGWTVRGVDAFTDYYEPTVKHANLSRALESPGFSLVETDLVTAELDALLDGVDVVFHLAGQPGVRLSWAEGFGRYVDLNIVLTQRLLEAAQHLPIQRFVYASSSSVYGNTMNVPTTEEDPTRPFSPYGVTKLAGEQLCCAYGANFAVPTISLRYFTVFGPRQRPDMGIHRIMEAALQGRAFQLFGDGEQIRDFTFVDDIVRATRLAGTVDSEPGTVLNIAGGDSVSMNALLEMIGDVLGEALRVDRGAPQPGDVRATGGDITRAGSVLGWAPEISLAEGLKRQAGWHQERTEGARQP